MRQTHSIVAASPEIRLADPMYNAIAVCKIIDRAESDAAAVLVLPELCLTGYTCGDLFFQPTLLRAAEGALAQIIEHTRNGRALVFVGLPAKIGRKTYSVAAVVGGGKLFGLVPRMDYSGADASRLRWFSAGRRDDCEVTLCGFAVPVSPKQPFATMQPNAQKTVFATVGSGAFKRRIPSNAAVSVNLSAQPETPQASLLRRHYVCRNQALCVVALAQAGFGESVTDNVYGGYCAVGANAFVAAESLPFGSGYARADLAPIVPSADPTPLSDMPLLQSKQYPTAFFVAESNKEPFAAALDLKNTWQDIVSAQAQALAARLKFTSMRPVLGVSGGLDSTLALWVCAQATDILGQARERILAVTMPGFGTTDQTGGNAARLICAVGATHQNIDIRASVTRHLCDIGHAENLFDTAYENAQARMRTLVLMNLCNMHGGLVVGTGDLSELALGFCTYGGDQLSMYGVNASLPKTVLRQIIAFKAQEVSKTDSLSDFGAVLGDIVATEISPELLPADQSGAIAQKTEQIIGPYALTDFFLYWGVFEKKSPQDVFSMAKQAFAGLYSPLKIQKWLKSFYRRFFAQQFKRTALAEGADVTGFSLSPRGGFVMPGDANGFAWLTQLETLEL